jgi:hypothetical protein
MKIPSEPIPAEEENSSETSISCIRRLMAAMLERAIRDLMTGSTVEVNSALRWLKSPTTKGKSHIPFLLIVETLDLGEFYLARIQAMIDEAESRHDRLRELRGEERKKRGLFVTDEEHTRVTEGGRRVTRFRRYTTTLKS